LNDFGNQACPPGLVGGAYSPTIIPVEIFVKLNVIAKMGVVLELIVFAKDRALSLVIPSKKPRQTPA
jgi:hypothetical protein